MNKIKFAVIGCGHIGKRHAEMILRNEDAELVALCDIRPKDELGIEKFDVPFYSSIEKFVEANISADVVTVATPNGLHAEHALKALAANYNIVVEKPMGLNKADSEKIIFKALKKHKHVFCVMQNRYSPPSVWLKEIVDQNLNKSKYKNE